MQPGCIIKNLKMKFTTLYFHPNIFSDYALDIYYKNRFCGFLTLTMAVRRE
jgi:hypothetical protein